MKLTLSSAKSRPLWLVVGIGALLIAVGVILHFVPIREEKGFIASTRIDESSAITCEAATEDRAYRLILNEMPKYNQTKEKFGKNVADGPCPPGVYTTVRLYVF